MTGDDLKLIMSDWNLNAAQLAKVLCLHSTKLSEYLADVQRIPCSVTYSIEALQKLSAEQRVALFEQRMQRAPHQHPKS